MSAGSHKRTFSAHLARSAHSQEGTLGLVHFLLCFVLHSRAIFCALTIWAEVMRRFFLARPVILMPDQRSGYGKPPGAAPWLRKSSGFATATVTLTFPFAPVPPEPPYIKRSL